MWLPVYVGTPERARLERTRAPPWEPPQMWVSPWRFLLLWSLREERQRFKSTLCPTNGSVMQSIPLRVTRRRWSLSHMGEGRVHLWVSGQLIARPYGSVGGSCALLKGTTEGFLAPSPTRTPSGSRTENPPLLRPALIPVNDDVKQRQTCFRFRWASTAW